MGLLESSGAPGNPSLVLLFLAPPGFSWLLLAPPGFPWVPPGSSWLPLVLLASPRFLLGPPGPRSLLGPLALASPAFLLGLPGSSEVLLAPPSFLLGPSGFSWLLLAKRPVRCRLVFARGPFSKLRSAHSNNLRCYLSSKEAGRSQGGPGRGRMSPNREQEELGGASRRTLHDEGEFLGLP